MAALGAIKAHAHSLDNLPESDYCGLCEKWEVLP